MRALVATAVGACLYFNRKSLAGQPPAPADGAQDRVGVAAGS